MRKEAWEKTAQKNLSTTKSSNQGEKAVAIPEIRVPIVVIKIVYRRPILMFNKENVCIIRFKNYMKSWKIIKLGFAYIHLNIIKTKLDNLYGVFYQCLWFVNNLIILNLGEHWNQFLTIAFNLGVLLQVSKLTFHRALTDRPNIQTQLLLSTFRQKIQM